MLLADEKFEECIGIIEEAKSLQIDSESVKFKLDFDVHVLKVIEITAKELQKPQIFVPEIYIGYLKRLDAMEFLNNAKFMSAFLETQLKKV